jgi:hypothetical protein
MSATIDYLPVWKQGATAEERLLELAIMAKKKPEIFSKFALVYIEEQGDRTMTRQLTFNCSTFEAAGILESGKWDILSGSAA